MLSESRIRHRWRSFLVAIFSLALLAAGCTPGGSGQPYVTPTPGSGGGVSAAEQMVAFASVTVGVVSQRRLSRVVVIPSQMILPAGETAVFSAVGYDNQGSAVPPQEVESRWRMLDRQAGAVTRTGVFRAGYQRGVYNQAVEVTVSQEVDGRLVEIQALASVSIIRPLSEQDISRVQVLPSELQVERQSQVPLVALAVDRDGVPIPGVSLSWEMLDARAGRVEVGGQFTSGTQLGTFPAAVRVVAHKKEDPTQSVTATLSVTVIEVTVAGVPSKLSLYPQAVTLRPGDTIAFRALALDQKGNLYKNVTTTWTLRNPTAGELDGQGRFRAGKTPGTYPSLVEVTVIPTEGGSPVSLRASATVTVLELIKNPQLVTRVLLTQEVVWLRPGESVRLGATALTRAGQLLPTAALRWSSNAEVAQVTPQGMVTAIGNPGIYENAVTVEATQGEGESQVRLAASARVIILGPLARVELVPQRVDVSPKQVVQFTYLAYDTNGVRLFDVTATWRLEDKRAGAIDSRGLFIAGATPGQYKDAIVVTVRPRLLKAGGR